MHLTELLEKVGIAWDGDNPIIKDLAKDSREVVPGALFMAAPGTKTDGRMYMENAIYNGAAAILCSKGCKLPDTYDGPKVPLIEVQNPRQVFAKICAAYFEKQPSRIVAVTGTNGKTSTVYFTQQLWYLSDIKAASFGTLGVRAPGLRKPGSLTTPPSSRLHAELADLASAGIHHVAMEASSHGLDQYRLDGVNVAAAAFTNITQDHLDYHQTMDKYFAAKLRLFSELLPEGSVAVLNADDDYFTPIKDVCEKRNIDIIDYGFNAQRIKVEALNPTPMGKELKLSIDGNAYDITLPLVGKFQVYNALCALGLVWSEKLNDAEFLQQNIANLEKLIGVPGRLQRAGVHPNGAAVFVDYAHTPDALQNVLEALRPHTKNKLHCVFGCGGDRDTSKRAVMGKIAAQLADSVIVTDDNPRTEDAARIRAQVLEGAKGATEIGNRREAIVQAAQNLQAGDVLVVAGKGHEQGQILADTVEPFDDVEEVQAALGNLSNTEKRKA